MPNVKRLREHHWALPYRDVPATIRKVRRSNAHPLMRLCFEFPVLTASRSGEVRLADWSEIDWELELWKVPAERMKARREHRVPLSGRALEILRDVWEITGPEGCIFPWAPQRRANLRYGTDAAATAGEHRRGAARFPVVVQGLGRRAVGLRLGRVRERVGAQRRVRGRAGVHEV